MSELTPAQQLAAKLKEKPPEANSTVNSYQDKLSCSLKELRLETGLTSARVALVVGCSHTMYVNWEAGRAAPSLYKAMLLAKFFGVTVHDIWTIKD